MPFGAWETGVLRTTSAGARVIAGAACDMICILAHRSNSGSVGGIFRRIEAGQAHGRGSGGAWTIQCRGARSSRQQPRTALVLDSSSRVAGHAGTDPAVVRHQSIARHCGPGDRVEAAQSPSEHAVRISAYRSAGCGGGGSGGVGLRNFHGGPSFSPIESFGRDRTG
jgi:hypothetical protein